MFLFCGQLLKESYVGFVPSGKIHKIGQLSGRTCKNLCLAKYLSESE